METNNIKTIEMTRAIRDKNARRLIGKSHAERIAFYHNQARKLQSKLSIVQSAPQTEETKDENR